MAMTRELEMIKDAIVKTVPVKKIYLFGSYARGTQTDYSDYDIYLVLHDNSMRPVEAIQKAYRSIRGVNRKSIDILANSNSCFNERKNLPTIERRVFQEGVVLYEK